MKRIAVLFLVLLIMGTFPTIAPVTAEDDTIAPVVTIDRPEDGADIHGNMVTLKGTVTDTGGSGVKRLEYKTDEEDTWFHITDKPTQPDWAINIGFAEAGKHTITVRASDNDGNKGEASIEIDLRFERDVEPQEVMIPMAGIIIVFVILGVFVFGIGRKRSNPDKGPSSRKKKKKDEEED